jgi:hypothetical protein
VVDIALLPDPAGAELDPRRAKGCAQGGELRKRRDQKFMFTLERHTPL